MDLNKECPNCLKTFSTASSCRRHSKTCQTKTTADADNEIMTRFIKQFIEMKKEMISLKEEVNSIKEENKELKAQMLQLTSLKPSSTLVNQGTIINGDQNNYHIQVNINMEYKPVNFGNEQTDHITQKTVQRLVERYGFAKVLTDLVQRIYNDPKYPMNMTLKLCPCNDPLCLVVAVHIEDEWRTKSFDEMLRLVYRKISDFLTQVCLEEVYTEGTKINKFDNELCDGESTKIYDIKAVKSGLRSNQIIVN